MRKKPILLLSLLLVGSQCSYMSGQSTDFVRLVPGGVFRNAVFWSPFDPVGPPPLLGPGDADDTVVFNLGFGSSDSYTITNVNGVNDQLIVRNDTLTLEITDYEVDSIGGGGNASIVVGQNNGEVGTVTLDGGIGSDLNSYSTTIGSSVGSTGTVNVQGITFVWDNEHQLVVGSIGTGNLNISDSAALFSGSSFIGVNSPSSGAATVNGFGARFASSGELVVGWATMGTLAANTGASITAFDTCLGRFSSGYGHISLSNALTNMTVDNELFVGESGMGIVDVLSGSDLHAQYVEIGREESGIGVVTVNGGDSTLTIDSEQNFENLFVGGEGSGELHVENGATVIGVTTNCARARIGMSSGSSGLLKVDGAGSTFVGDIIAIGRNGTLSVVNGGQLDCVDFHLVDSIVSSAAATVSGIGSNLTVSYFTRIDEGMLTIDAGASASTYGLTIGDDQLSDGEMLVSGPGTIYESTAAGILIGREGNGVLTIDDGGTVTTPFLTLSKNPGTYTDLYVFDNSFLEIANSVNSYFIAGDKGFAETEVSGGSALICDECMIARSPGAIGYFDVKDPGSELNVAQSLAVGGDVNGDAGGLAILTISGISSDLNGATVNVGGDVLVLPNGELRIQDEGRLNAGTLVMLGGTVDIQGGRINAAFVEGDLTNVAGQIAPAQDDTGNTTITGDLSQGANASMSFDIGGTIVNTEYDFINVLGAAFVNGDLELELTDGFVPDPSHSLTIFSAGSLLGFFNNVGDNQRLDTVDGSGSFLVRYGATSPNPNQIILSEFEPDGGGTLYGDVNLDGTVNLLDVAPFIDRLATGDFQEEADINMDGSINLLDVDPFIDLLAG